jgi:hypothetical protein
MPKEEVVAALMAAALFGKQKATAVISQQQPKNSNWRRARLD